MKVKIKPDNLVNPASPIEDATGGKGPTDEDSAMELLNQGYVQDNNRFGKSEYEHREEAERKGWY